MKAPEKTFVSYLGKRTGQPRSCRVRAAMLGHDLVIRVGHPDERRWWRNFLSPWPITVLRAGHVVQGTARAVCGESEEGGQLGAAYFSRYHVSRRHPDRSSPERLTFIRVTPRLSERPIPSA